MLALNTLKTDNYIFENLNFKIPKGQRLAIVGLNGAGKSTLVKLITGLYDVDEGEILINGIPIKDFNKKNFILCFLCSRGKHFSFYLGRKYSLYFRK